MEIISINLFFEQSISRTPANISDFCDSSGYVSMNSLDSHFLQEISKSNVFFLIFHCVKSILIRSFSGSYFPAFGLNKEIY